MVAISVLCSAHIGSPDVWYEGSAGPYRVVVYIRVPTVIPGIADIQVQVPGEPASLVTAVVNLFNATAGTPPPDVAAPLPTGDGWYGTRLWIMSPGSNSVTVTVEGSKGSGTVIVPVTAVASQEVKRSLDFQRALLRYKAGLDQFPVFGREGYALPMGFAVQHHAV